MQIVGGDSWFSKLPRSVSEVLAELQQTAICRVAAQTKTAEEVSINGIETTKQIEPWQANQDHPVTPHFLVPSLTERVGLF